MIDKSTRLLPQLFILKKKQKKEVPTKQNITINKLIIDTSKLLF